ncbi:MAG: 1,4-dihydroxy-2-naphthoate polyprenyltransferase [Ilumatobacter coccineus]|uniref:1,4-dihydroxy-2-naphthoate octaprenyltransferase n=1 Tax=Ilumatobacter coccineus TaxID=467094 RepID=A0A2G6KBM5_9ACTN|nr:MAG: 1,4-dihydroxy-2-naphthoate polyprenyltransferase [Ilumatobacter coccineus]
MSNTPTPRLADWIAGARPRTLPAAVVPVAVGAGAAVGYEGAAVVWWRVIAALAISLLLQIGVNYANDYSDGVRGTDDDRVGPMRLVASRTASPRSVKIAAISALALAGVIGMIAAAATSWWLVAIGVVAILAAWGYTGGPKPYGYLGLGEVFVFVFFGLVATVGTTFLAIEALPGVVWPASVGVGLLACALLMINNLRDIPTDRETGKMTLAVRLGDRRARAVFVGLIVGAVMMAVVSAFMRPWAALAAISLVIAWRPIRAVRRGDTGSDLVPVLAATGMTQLVYGALLTVGLVVSTL